MGVALAILERRAGIDLSSSDVYVSIAGGLRGAEPGIDLALCLALASARFDKPLPASLAAVGEVGLGGEVRSVSGMSSRAAELLRLGFTSILMTAGGACESQGRAARADLEQRVPVRTISEALARLGSWK